MATLGSINCNSLVGGVRLGAIRNTTTINGTALGSITSTTNVAVDGTPGSGEDGIQVEKRLGTTTAPRGYLQYLPDDYSLTSDEYPCFIYYHGFGERGNGTTELFRVRNGSGTPPWRLHLGTWNAVEAGQKCIVISPQQFSGMGWTGSGVHDGLEFAQWLITNGGYRINLNKVYCLGFSLGGRAVLEMVATSANNPNIFAGGCSVSDDSAFNIGQNYGSKNVPLYVFYRTSGDSTTEPAAYNGYLTTIDPGINHNIVIMPGSGHSCNIVFDSVTYSPNIYELLLAESL